MKYADGHVLAGAVGRTPQGVRGLKFPGLGGIRAGRWSHPARGAWVEIGFVDWAIVKDGVAPRKGCVG